MADFRIFPRQTIQEEWKTCGSPAASLAKYRAMVLAPSQSPGALAHLNILGNSLSLFSKGLDKTDEEREFYPSNTDFSEFEF
ncbi:hypothetical protein E5288_WYG014499 [Bos mutus]|uniref:Uncharacterized protein n=1 Tax=Bos mutus TaxID=72004 RepID=A0A6B0R129_9CETA|nr:hypothetical protein [Bos mutus]